MLAEHVRLEREALESTAAKEFWCQSLAGSRATSLQPFVPHETPATADPVVTVLIPQLLQDAAGQLAKSRGLPMKSLLLAAHCVILQRLSGKVDVTTGLVTHGRPGRASAEVAAGLFLNTIPIRLDDKPATWLDAVERIAQFERASYRYRRYPLQAMQSDAGRPLFNTVFNYVNYHPFAELAGTTGIELLDFDVHEQTNFALLATAGIDPRTQRLFLRVTGDPQSVTATQAHEYANTFMRALAAIARSPEQAIDLGTDELTARRGHTTDLPTGRDQPRHSCTGYRRRTADRTRRVPLPRRRWSRCSPRYSVWTPLVYTIISSPLAETRSLPSSCAVRLRSVASLSISRNCSPGPRSPNWPSRVHGRRRSRKASPNAFALLPLIDRAALHDAEDAFPANALQLGMLFHSIERAESTMYKDVFRYHVAMPWREEEFIDAFDRLVARHPALRSSFELNQHSAPVQVVRSRVPRAFDVVTGACDADVEITWPPATRNGTTSTALRCTACARLSGMTVWIWSFRFITHSWTAGVLPT